MAKKKLKKTAKSVVNRRGTPDQQDRARYMEPQRYDGGDNVTPGSGRRGAGYEQTPDNADRTRARTRKRLGYR